MVVDDFDTDIASQNGKLSLSLSLSLSVLATKAAAPGRKRCVQKLEKPSHVKSQTCTSTGMRLETIIRFRPPNIEPTEYDWNRTDHTCALIYSMLSR